MSCGRRNAEFPWRWRSGGRWKIVHWKFIISRLMISPEEFIPVAEQTGMIAQIGDFVFTEVCRFLSSGAPQHAGLQFVEVNLSVVQCMNTQLPERLLSIAEGYGVSTSEINLEITESAMVYSMNTMRSVMEELTKEGFSFALDDFGTGRANLSYIQNFPFRIIKVDKSFLWAEGESEDNHVIFENMLSLIRAWKRRSSGICSFRTASNICRASTTRNRCRSRNL